MTASKKIRVAVLFGGRSAEHEVSLQSAMNVIQYLDASQFEVTPVGIDKEGRWLIGEEVFKKSLEEAAVKKISETDATWFTPEWVGKEVLPQDTNTKNRLPSNEHHFDVVFPVVHGAFCEDGTLQGLLELARLPYVGCGVLASSVGMDKDVSKRLAAYANIKTPPYIALRKESFYADQENCLQAIEEMLHFPVFVKPANTGSSIGVTKAKTKEQLIQAIERAFQFDTKIVIEKGLNVRELEVAVLQSLEKNGEPIVSVVGEVKPSHEFYSYEAKYLDEHGAELVIPADLPPHIAKAARETAKKLFQLLECEGMARVDLFLEKETQQIYFNEINTIPGFTKISMYPKLMEASGITYASLLTHLIQLAIKRYEDKNILIRNYSDT